MKLGFTQKIKDFIKREELLDNQKKYLVALSGGADSVALLLVLQELGYTAEACHCNFLLRGKESNRDEQFCIDLCQRLNTPLHRIHFDTHTYAETHKVSIEMAARELRYKYFEELKGDINADGICVAHHQDDSIETVLINLLRGTGIKGLTGIAPKNGDIIRPLLCVNRKEILDFLAKRKQDYVTDSTNLIDDVVRNKIRLNVIPMLREINPAVCQNIITTSHYLKEAAQMLDAIEQETQHVGVPGDGSPVSMDDFGVIYVSKEWIKGKTSQEYALFTALKKYGFNGKTIDDIKASLDMVGKIWHSDTYQMVIDRDYLVLENKDKGLIVSKKMPEPGCYIVPPLTFNIPVSSSTSHAKSLADQKIKMSIEQKTADFSPSKEKWKITLDASKVSFPLTLRLAENGDQFHPFGMNGRKLVSDYLTDRKKNRLQKQSQMVLSDASGNIIWLIGERTSDDCKVDEATAQILKIEIAY